MTRLQLVVDDPFLFGIQINVMVENSCAEVQFFLVDPEFSQHLLVGMLLLRFDHSRASASAFSSSAVTGSSSMGARAMARIRIKHRFEQANHRGELGRRKPLDQLVACRFSLVEPWVEPCAMRISLAKSTALAR